MLINFEQIPESIIPNMRGGEGQVASHMYVDGDNKIMKGLLATSSEIIYVLSGTGKVLYDGQYEPLSAGSVHYCPKSHEHSLINDGDGDLTFFAVVPEHGA